jgi:hypothetical protein
MNFVALYFKGVFIFILVEGNLYGGRILVGGLLMADSN